jgi:RNA polymerase sigma factor (sigma-70 family)
MQDQQAWINFVAGSEPAFTFLYQKYAPPLFRYGCKFCPDRDFVKECLQSLFCNLWNNRSRFRQPESVKHYLFKAFRTEVFKLLAERQQFNSHPAYEQDQKADPYEADLIQLTTARYQREQLQKSLSRLPDRQREIIYLKYYANLSYSDIAGIMGLEQESAYKLLYKGIKKLQELLREQRLAELL